jgi:membrane carboxypeptidase/penicillin-binding protein PbpC
LPKPPNIDKFPFVSQDLSKDTINRVSTIDANLQEFTEKILNQTLNELKSKNVTNSAVFAINPKTNEVLLYI